MTVQDCHDRLARGEPLDVIDVRTPAEFRAIHATAARSVPLDLLVAFVGDAGPSRGPFALLCKSGARAAKGRDALRVAGVENVEVVEGGTDAWLAAGLPCVRGTSRVPTLERQVRIVAGSLVAIGTGLGYFVHPAWLIVPGLVGSGLAFAGITDTCGMAMLLARMPWNRR